MAVLDGKIYVGGGFTGDYSGGTPLSETQIYDPAANAWIIGVPLPTPLGQGVGAVVNHVWYVMGGTTDGRTRTSATWAYDARAAGWIAEAPMPIALEDAGVAVYKNIIYLVGGSSNSMSRAHTVESYNPATDIWTEEAPLLAGKSEPAPGHRSKSVCRGRRRK